MSGSWFVFAEICLPGISNGYEYLHNWFIQDIAGQEDQQNPAAFKGHTFTRMVGGLDEIS